MKSQTRLSIGCILLGAWLHACADEMSHAPIVDALRGGAIERGLDLATQAAGEGDPWAMDIVGLLYLSGPKPIGRDFARARQWLEKAAAAGNGDAMSRLGEIFANGWGVPENKALAVDWYRRGAEQGSYSAMNNLATALLAGEAMTRNIPEGLEWLRKAAEKDPVAQENLAHILRSGEFGETDRQAAFDLFRKAAERGSSRAMISIAQMYFNGEMGKPDIALSCRWALLAYPKGRREASEHLNGVCRTRMSQEALAAEVDAAKRWIDAHPDAFGALARP